VEISGDISGRPDRAAPFDVMERCFCPQNTQKDADFSMDHFYGRLFACFVSSFERMDIPQAYG